VECWLDSFVVVFFFVCLEEFVYAAPINAACSSSDSLVRCFCFGALMVVGVGNGSGSVDPMECAKV